MSTKACSGALVCFLLGLTIVAALTACVPFVGGGGPTPTLDPSLYDLSILTDQPCAAPCWYGLEPGRSTKEQVLTTVHTLPFVDSAKTEQLPYYYRDSSRQIDKTGTYLRLRCRRPGGGPCAGLLLLQDILKEIDLFPPPALTFDELVSHFGPPDAVRANPLSAENAVTCNLGMIWKQRAIWVAFLNSPSRGDQVRCADISAGHGVDPSLPVGQAIYSTADDPLIVGASGASADLPWPGFAKP